MRQVTGWCATWCCPAATRLRRSPRCWREVPAGFRVIVVDNGSRDGTAEVARRLGATVVIEDRPGLRRGGARRAAGRDRRPGGVHGRRRLLRPGRAAADGRRRALGARGHRRRSPPPHRARDLAVARPRRQRADRGLAAAPDRAARPRHRADAGLPARRPARARRSRTGGSATRSSCSRRPPAPAGGSTSATSPTDRVPRAPSRRCPARCAGTDAHRARLRAGAVVTLGARRGQGARAGPGEDPAGRTTSAWKPLPRSPPPRSSTPWPPAPRPPRTVTSRWPATSTARCVATSCARPSPAGPCTRRWAPTSPSGWPTRTPQCPDRSCRSAWTPRT